MRQWVSASDTYCLGTGVGGAERPADDRRAVAFPRPSWDRRTHNESLSGAPAAHDPRVHTDGAGGGGKGPSGVPAAVSDRQGVNR